MSIKALQRRAREAHQWLGQRALPLWADVGMLREGGVVSALQLNHRPNEAPEPGTPQAQVAMANLFALAPAVGFDRAISEDVLAKLKAAENTALEQDVRFAAAHSLEAICDDLRLSLISLTTADNTAANGVSEAACRAFDTLMDDFLTPEGGWFVGYGEDGLLSHPDIPAALAGAVAAPMALLLPLAQA
ncbi:MAG: hypothetical protein AAGI03_03630 [Pseudomonadota bacterium]